MSGTRPGVARLAASAIGVLAVAVGCSTTRPAPPVTSASTTVSTATGGAHRTSGGTWPTYHHDDARSGYQPAMSSLRHAKVAWTFSKLDGDVYAEPLVVGSRVIVATEANFVYALDASTGSVAWRASLGAPVQASTLPCGNISPTSGITSTPVADPSTGIVYVAAFLDPGRHELFALRLRSGAVAWHRSIDPPGMDPLTQQLRAALLLSRGRVYAAYGGLFGDCGEYHGWVVGVDADGRGPLIDYRVPTDNAGGIWAPAGPAADPSGDLYVATGNSFTSDGFDFGSAVIELSPGLKEIAYFAPSDWAELNAGDVDLGSVGPALLPGHRVFQIGKAGVGYLLDGDHLGGIGGELHSAAVCSSSFGATAHVAATIYVPCTDGLTALTVSADGRSFHGAWRSSTFQSGPPIVAGGLVWAIDISAGALVAFDAATGREVMRRAIGETSHFASPAAAARCVYAPALRAITAVCGP